MDLSEFTEAFFEEADELLLVIERELLAIDPTEPDPEDLNAIFRAAHSIKGGAGTFGFTVLQETTHLLENLLDDARRGELALTQNIVDQFLETKDMLKDQLDAYRDGTAPDQQKFEELCRMLSAIGEENRTSPPSPENVEHDAVQNCGDAGEEAKPTSMASDDGFELFEDGETAPKAAQLRVTLRAVDEKDLEVLLRELDTLGEVLEKSGDREHFEILLATQECADDLKAVLCFVVDEEQISIDTPGERPPQVTEAAPGLEDGTGTADEAAGHDASAPSSADAAAPEARTPTGPDDKTPDPTGTSADDTQETPAAVEHGTNARAQARGGAESSSIRVAVDKVDQVINLVGELIITQSMLNETVNGLDLKNNSELFNGINLLQRNARDLQDAVMSIRMLPMDYVFSRFPRLVRDLARKMGKEINLVTEGEATELDKGLTERIIDPLTHLVRNSLDHGLEPPELREAAGKPRQGQLFLSAQHQGGNIVIEVRDDGAGLDRERILAKARSRKLPVSETPSDDEIWQLIFEPGFSTAEEVSDLSGRGVGMDVVKRNIQAMGGHVEISSAPGQGTATRIILPLTLAILDGMLIRVGAEIYIIPVSAIIESLQLRNDRLTSLPGNVPMLKVRDEYYPVVSMHDAMGVASETKGPDGERQTAVMVQGGSARFVVLVDELLGQQQVVVKNLEANYRRIPGVAAATILGDGSVALILDVADLFRLAKTKPHKGQRARVSTDAATKGAADDDTRVAVEAPTILSDTSGTSPGGKQIPVLDSEATT